MKKTLVTLCALVLGLVISAQASAQCPGGVCRPSIPQFRPYVAPITPFAPYRYGYVQPVPVPYYIPTPVPYAVPQYRQYPSFGGGCPGGRCRP